MIFGGVEKSGSPISRWMMSLPWRSNARARLSTSNAVSVPSRDMRFANRSSDWTTRVIGAKRLIVLPLRHDLHDGGRLTRRFLQSVALRLVHHECSGTGAAGGCAGQSPCTGNGVVVQRSVHLQLVAAAARVDGELKAAAAHAIECA